METFLGQIITVGFNFAPRGWLLCNGQLLSISQNQALFALLGTTYGGDGRTTFALPDLRGRRPIGFSHGPGLSNYALGQRGGVENVTLTVNQIPPHTHTMLADNESGTTPANGGYLNAFPAYSADTNTSGTLNTNTITNTGGNQSHYNMPPSLGLYWCIATQGVFPSRS